MDNIKKIEDFLSNSRFQPYLDYCKMNNDEALRLYQMNLRLNGAFSPILSMLEVALRNSLDRTLTSKYPLSTKDNWLTQLKEDINIGIMNAELSNADFANLLNALSKAEKGINSKIDTNIRNFLKREYRSVKEFKEMSYEKQELKINEDLEGIKLKRGIKIKKDVIIANMDFSFWTGVFDKKPYNFLESEPRKVRLFEIFDMKSNGVFDLNNDEKSNRSLIADKLYNIRKFRNRVAHNEPLIFVGQRFDVEFPRGIRNDIMFLLRSLNQNLEIYSEDIYAINTHLIKIEDYCENIGMTIKK